MFGTNLSKNLATYVLILVGLILPGSLTGSSVALAEDTAAFIRQVRTFDPYNFELPHAGGLAFSPQANAFLVLKDTQTDQPAEILLISPFADLLGSVSLTTAVTNPLNMAFDSRTNSLFLFEPTSRELIVIKAGADGRPNPATITRIPASQFRLQNPQGMSFDPASGRLFILDAAASQLVGVEPDPARGFERARLSRVALQQPGLVEPRGLALDPSTGHLHLLSPAEQKLYEVTRTGQLVATRELAEFELDNVQGLVFAPSADLTDNPAQLNLYMATTRPVVGGGQGGSSHQSGQTASDSMLTSSVEDTGGTGEQSSGQITEFSLAEPVQLALAAETYVSTLVQTIEAWRWSPPSPDSAGVVYLPASNTLLVADSEVNETNIFTGDNLYEATLSGKLNKTLTTISFSDEPTGVTLNPANEHLFFSDDTGTRSIYELNPGSDGQYDTSDDIVTSFETNGFGSNDPEGVTYCSACSVPSGSEALFITDGVNTQIYQVTPGANGIFDGADDEVTSFDTGRLGLSDPEGIAFNWDNGNLYAVGSPADMLFEITTSGDLVRTIDISAANADKPAGLAYGPGSQDSAARHIYIATRGADSGSNVTENDGKVHEMTLPSDTTVPLPPVANDDATSTTEDTPVTIPVATNDTDPNGNLDPTTANICSPPTCSNPANGQLVNNLDGTFDYTPDPGFTGLDTFVYEICDTDTLCDTATVTVTVSPNIAPVANDDSASTTVDAPVTIDVAANDTDPNGNLDPATANICPAPTCSNPDNGSLVNNFDGSFNYTPDPGFIGSDSFVYQICDTGALCDIATVTIATSNAAPSEIEVRVGASIDDAEESDSGSVSLTSSDLELVLESTIQTVGMRFNGLTIPPGANITNASIQFQADEINSEATSLLIQGEVVDNAAAFDSSINGNISSRPRTTAAVAWSPAPWQTKGEAGPDQQTPNIAPVIQEIVNRSGWSNGNSLVIIVTGSGKRVAEAFNGDQAGAPLLHVEYVTGSSNNPPVANDDTYTTDEDTQLSVAAPGVLGNDTDVEGDLLTAVLVSDVSSGTLSLVADGSFTYTPTTGFIGTDSFTYRANDGQVDSNLGTVTITVNEINDPPLANDATYTTDEDTQLSVAAPGVLGNDTDTENDPLTAALVGDVSNGTLNLAGDGSFTYDPNPNFAGSDSFTYRANDGLADSNPATVTITVNEVNDPPVANDDTYMTDEDTQLIVAAPGVLGNDTDVESALLTAVLVSGVSSGTLSLVADGSFTYTPTTGFIGTDSFTYRTNDGQADSNLGTVTITVNEVNDPPVANANAYTTDEDTQLSVAAPGVLGNDTDTENEPLTAALVGDVSNGTLNLAGDGSFTYDPNPNFAGSDSFTYRANDGQADSNLATVTITVNEVNDSPVANDDDYTTDVNNPLSVPALSGVLGNDTDVEDDPLTAVLVSDVSSGTLSLAADGSFTYTPNTGFTGTDSFTYRTNDGQADSSPATVTINVIAVLSLTAIQPNTMPAGSTLDVTITGSNFVAGASLTFESGSGPAPQVSEVIVVDASTITAKVTTKSGGPPRSRFWDVRVTNPDGSTDVLAGAFEVTP